MRSRGLGDVYKRQAGRDGRGRVAGDADQPRVEPLGHAAEQAGNAGGDLRLGLVAIGQAGIVSRVDHRRLRQQLATLGQDRKAADAGIEEQDRCRYVPFTHLTLPTSSPV